MSLAAVAVRPVPTMLFVGELPIVLPDALDRLKPAKRAMIARAETDIANMLATGYTVAANRVALRVEASLGVTMADRVAAMKAGDDLDAVIEHALGLISSTQDYTPPKPTKAQRKAAREAALAGLKQPPAAPGEITAQQLENWDRYTGWLTDPGATQDMRDTARTALANMERRWRAERETAWQQKALAESVTLAKARGDEVEVKTAGRVAVITRAGLKMAFEAGYLDGGQNDQELYDIGRMYRDCYERSQGGTTPSGSGTASGKRDGPQHSLLDAGEVLRVMRSAQSERRLFALDMICGEDATINIAATAYGCHRLTMAKRLRDGLLIALENWKGRKDRAPDAPFRLPTKAELQSRDEQIVAAERSC